MLLRETLLSYGPESLADHQLVAALLRSNSIAAPRLIARFGGLRGLLAAGPAELAEQGLSPQEQTRLGVLGELLRRSSRATERPRITSPRAAGEYLLPKAQGWTEERFGLLALNAKGDLLADRILSQGTATACLISPREFFREALRFGATTALAWHNHPSGDPTPSREDIALTRRLREVGDQLGVPLADHVVVGGDRYHSFRASEGWDRA